MMQDSYTKVPSARVVKHYPFSIQGVKSSRKKLPEMRHTRMTHFCKSSTSSPSF